MDRRAFDQEDRLIEELLRQLRVKHKLTQPQLAVALGRGQSFVSNYERGHHRLRIPEVRHICKALDIPLGQFIKKYEAAVATGQLPETVTRQRVRRKPTKT